MWVFQTRAPFNFRVKYPDTPPVFRRSTRTKDKRTALKIARRWLIQLEDSWESAMHVTSDDDQGGVFTLKSDEVLGFRDGDEFSDLSKMLQHDANKRSSKRKSEIQLDEVLNKWIATKKKPSTAEAYGHSGRLFVGFMRDIGVTTINGVTHAAMRRFRDALPQIPANSTKKFGKHALVHDQ